MTWSPRGRQGLTATSTFDTRSNEDAECTEHSLSERAQEQGRDAGVAK